MPGPAIGAGMSVAGNLIGGLNNAAAARRSNRILEQGSREQSRAGMESTAVLGDFLSQLRGSAPDMSERGAFTGAVRGGPQVGGLPTASRAFRSDAAGATRSVGGDAAQMADWLARIRAPGLQRQRESEMFMDAGNLLRPIQQRADDQAFMTQLRAGQQRPNPWVNMLGGGLAAAGNYMVANG